MSDRPEPTPPRRKRQTASNDRVMPAATPAAALLTAEPFDDVFERELARLPLNDVGNAERFRRRNEGRFLFVPEMGWLVWIGTHWSGEHAEAALMRAAVATAEAIGQELAALKRERQEVVADARRSGVRLTRDDDGHREPADGEDGCALQDRYDEIVAIEPKLAAWRRETGNRARLSAMTAVAQAYIHRRFADMNPDPALLGTSGGIIRLEGDCRTMRPAEPEDYLTSICGVAHDPSATCPTFLRVLGEVQPDGDVRAFLQRWFGYCLFGHGAEQVFLFCFGGGQNGKSTVIDAVAHVIGDYATTIDINTLLDSGAKRGSEASPDIARLPGKRMLRASEPGGRAMFDEAKIKSLTSGEPIIARHLNRDFFEFMPVFSLTISGNHKPRIQGQDLGIWRRILLLPWLVTVTRRDRDLPARLRAEAAGILNWLLDGAAEYCRRGLDPPESVRVATEHYRQDSDPLGRFLADRTERIGGERVQASVLFSAFLAWCKANGEREWTATGFGRAMNDRGFDKERSGVVAYVGLRLTGGDDGAYVPPDAGDFDR